MTEHPIIFSGPMVRAILRGQKTQTRRIARWDQRFPPDAELRDELVCHCPYGSAGDLLWVRETWSSILDDARTDSERVVYRADLGSSADKVQVWRPSIHMPRWASRLTLRIAEVRVQRLQEISEEDAEAEGITGDEALVGQIANPFRTAYADLWDSINAKRGYGWGANPWVWVLTFEVQP